MKLAVCDTQAQTGKRSRLCVIVSVDGVSVLGSFFGFFIFFIFPSLFAKRIDEILKQHEIGFFFHLRSFSCVACSCSAEWLFLVRVLLTVEVSVYFAAWTTTASVCEEPLVHIKSVARQRILEASEFLVFCGENIGFTARRTGISGVFFSRFDIIGLGSLQCIRCQCVRRECVLNKKCCFW